MSDAALDLRGHVVEVQLPHRTEAAVVAIGTAADSYGAVDVRAGESGINAYFVYRNAEFPTQKTTEWIVSVHCNFALSG
jgi:hypothetical protein